MKKILTILLLLVALTACSTGNVIKNEDTIKIGAILPLTGIESGQGEIARNSLLLAKEELGNNVEIYFQDTKSKQTEAVTAYKYLKDVYDVDAVFVIGSPSAMALSPLVNEDKVMLFAFASAPPYSSEDDYTFRLNPSAIEEGVRMSKMVYKNNKKVAIVHSNNAYGMGIKDAFEKPFEELGGEVVIEGFESTTDFRDVITKVKAENVDAIFLASFGKEAGLFAKQAKELDLDVNLFCGQACMNPDLLVGGEAVEGIIFPFLNMDIENEFNKKYFDTYQTQTTQIGEKMYDVVYFLNEAKCETEECFLENAFTTSTVGSSSVINFDRIGNLQEGLSIYTVEDGKILRVE